MNTRDSRSYSALRCRESAIFFDSPYHECPYSLPCCARGAGEGQESDVRTNLQGAPLCDCCCRQRFLRVCSWRVPPRWSPRDWFAEMRSVGSAAGLLAIKDFDRAKGGLSPCLWGSGCWLGRLPDTDRNGPMLHGAFLKPSRMRMTAVCIGRKEARPKIRLLRLG
jgi:hypothetical protein